MAEVDRRRLYLGEACSSMFVYATERLRLSESQAYERITVARRSREFPALLEMIADGRLTLTAASKLGPHLTAANAAALLARSVHATRRQVECLVAEVAPQPDAASRVRKLPASPTATARPAEVRPAGVAVGSATALVPIAPARYRVQFTASAELEGKIARARALLRHKIPSGDIAAIIEEAITVLVARLERTRCAATDRPRTTTPSASESRHVPAAVTRAVWKRDESRCTFVDRHGRRCEARELLEIHHVEPFGKGGTTSLENLRLLCRAPPRAQPVPGRARLRRRVHGRETDAIARPRAPRDVRGTRPGSRVTG
jgi:5-methylcytosine-specific restriction endonuclease McrA